MRGGIGAVVTLSAARKLEARFLIRIKGIHVVSQGLDGRERQLGVGDEPIHLELRGAGPRFEVHQTVSGLDQLAQKLEPLAISRENFKTVTNREMA